MSLWRPTSLKSTQLTSQFRSKDRSSCSTRRATVSVQKLSDGTLSYWQWDDGFFILLWPSTDWMGPSHTGEDNLLSSIYQLKCSFHPKMSSQKYPNNI